MSQTQPENEPMTDPHEPAEGSEGEGNEPNEVDVDERSEQSFLTSDPPETWAGEDQPDD
jgi:hypothetical protein